MSIKRKTIFKIVIVISILIVVIGLAGSYYFLVLKQQNTDPIPQAKPTPTPTPKYMAYIVKPADYVGEIEGVTTENNILLSRIDGSRVILDLQDNVPIYRVKVQTGLQPVITQIGIKLLRVGDTLSVYTNEDGGVAALFLYDEQQ